MPFTTPTLAEARKSVRDYIAAKLAGADATVPNSALRVIADATGGLADQVFAYIDWLSGQFLPDTAESVWLRRWGTILFGGWKAATFSSGSATLSGSANLVVPSGSLLSYAGQQYQTTADVTLGAGATAAAIVALIAGSAGNLDTGTNLQLSTAIQGVSGTAVVVSLTGGTDEESVEELRLRVLNRLRKPPMGGDADDYVAWALAVPGVTRAWCSPNEMGVGTVTVRFMCDDLRATSDPTTNGFPLPVDIAAVQAALDDVRPVAVKELYVLAPVPEPITFTVSGLSVDSSSNRAAIAVSVAAMLAERAAPSSAINGVRVPAQTIYRAWVSDAILNTPGVDHFDLSMTDHAMPGAGSMAVLLPNGITFS